MAAPVGQAEVEFRPWCGTRVAPLLSDESPADRCFHRSGHHGRSVVRLKPNEVSADIRLGSRVMPIIDELIEALDAMLVRHPQPDDARRYRGLLAGLQIKLAAAR